MKLYRKFENQNCLIIEKHVPNFKRIFDRIWPSNMCLLPFSWFRYTNLFDFLWKQYGKIKNLLMFNIVSRVYSPVKTKTKRSGWISILINSFKVLLYNESYLNKFSFPEMVPPCNFENHHWSACENQDYKFQMGLNVLNFGM